MKKLLISCLMISFLPLLSIAQNTKTVAAAYPGCVKEMYNDRSGSVLFYSKDGSEKIVAYYEQVYGKAQASDVGNHSRFIRVPGPKENDTGNGAPGYVMEGMKRGVTVRSKPPKENYFVSQAFAQLQSAYLARFSGTSLQDKMKHRNDPELLTVIKQYEYLKNSFFIRVKSPTEADIVGIEELLYSRFFASAEDQRERKMNDLTEAYTKMILDGNMEEAAKISERINSLSQASQETTDKWQTAITYLKELEKLAYATMIEIDNEP